MKTKTVIKDSCGDRTEIGWNRDLFRLTVEDSVFFKDGRSTAELDVEGAEQLARELIKFLRGAANDL